MKPRLYKAATSLALIMVIALGARITFEWNQERKMRADLVGLVPFLNETGNIAYSLAAGHGYSSPYWQETGPTAWLTPVYPALVAGVFRIFGIHTPHSFFAIVFLNILFSTATCVPIFYIGKRVSDWEWRAARRGCGRFFPTQLSFRTNGFGIRHCQRC